MTPGQIFVVTFLAALGGGLGAGLASVAVGIRWERAAAEERQRREERAEAERRQYKREERARAVEIQAAMAELLGCLAMQATGEADRIRDAKQCAARARSRLRELGVNLPQSER